MDIKLVSSNTSNGQTKIEPNKKIMSQVEEEPHDIIEISYFFTLMPP